MTDTLEHKVERLRTLDRSRTQGRLTVHAGGADPVYIARDDGQFIEKIMTSYGYTADAEFFAAGPEMIGVINELTARLALALEAINKADNLLAVPAAEYVPAIPEAWEMLEQARCACFLNMHLQRTRDTDTAA